MDYNDRIIKHPDYSDVSSDEEDFVMEVREEPVSDGDSDPMEYCESDIIEISSDEFQEEDENLDEQCEDDHVVTVTHTIGITMTKTIKYKNSEVLSENRSLDIYFSEGLDPKGVDISKVTEEALQEIPVFLDALKRQNCANK
jgi:hypothetical protein